MTTAAANDFAATSPPASQRPLAIVTGASSGIGFELARCCAALAIAARQPRSRARLWNLGR